MHIEPVDYPKTFASSTEYIDKRLQRAELSSTERFCYLLCRMTLPPVATNADESSTDLWRDQISKDEISIYSCESVLSIAAATDALAGVTFACKISAWRKPTHPRASRPHTLGIFPKWVNGYS